MAWADEMTSLSEAVRDGLGGASVTFRRVTPGAMNTTTGARAASTSDTTVTAVRGMAEIDIDGDMRSRKERVRYTIVAADLSFRPDVGDQVIDGSKTCRVTRIGTSVDEKMYECDTERILTAQ